MFKIIVSNKVINEIVIREYCKSDEYYELEKIDDKYVIESVQRYINFFAYKSSLKKVGIISNGNELSVVVQNKLLKVLEETQEKEEHYLFVSNINSLLDTIVSRAVVIVEHSTYEFKPQNKLEVFFADIIESRKDEEYFRENEEYFRGLYGVCHTIVRAEYNVAIIKASSIEFDRVNVEYFIKWVENYCYTIQKYEEIKKLFNLEKRANYQVNYNLLVDVMIGVFIK